MSSYFDIPRRYRVTQNVSPDVPVSQYNNPFGLNYPFIDPSDDIKGLVYDAYVSYYDPTLNYKLPLRITEIGPSYVAVLDNDDNVVFEGDLTRTPWNSEYYILQGEKNGVVVSFIISNAVSYLLQPEHGELCLRCVYTMPKHVTSIRVEDKVLTGKINLEYGYNTDLNTSIDNSEPVRPNSIIQIDMGPGLGLGKVQRTCTDTYLTVVNSINGVEPDEHGDVALTGDDCMSIMHVASNGFVVADGCTPCCECEEFTDAGKELDELIDQYYVQGATSEAARDATEDLVNMLTCGNVLIGLKEAYYPVRCYIDTTWKRKPAITAEFRNVLPAVVYDLKITVSVQCSPLYEHKALRTMYMDDVTHSNIYNDTQDTDNYNRISGIYQNSLTQSSNRWEIDWSDTELSPGATVWCTIAARNGSTPKYKPAETIVAIVNATYKLKPVSCAEDVSDCLSQLNIINTDTASGTIKGGTAYYDSSGDITTATEGNDAEIIEDIRRTAGKIHHQDTCSDSESVNA